MKTKIEWTEKTWNPITGCTKYSDGCKNCYAETLIKRFQRTCEKFRNGFKVTLQPQSLKEPLAWAKGCHVFVCSMSDLFHEEVPFEYIDQVMNIIKQCPQHTFQILTKRAERMEQYFLEHACFIPKNVWLGVTVENTKAKYRIEHLIHINAVCRFLSCEPLLTDLGQLDLRGIDWVIVGGESGPRARPMKEPWVINIKAQCADSQVPFFFKQWGTYGPDGTRGKVKTFQGETIHEMPTPRV